MKIKLGITTTSVCGLALALTGCVTPSYKKATNDIRATQNQIRSEIQRANTSEPAVIDKLGYYVNNTPIAMDDSTNWLRQRVTLQAKALPMQLMIEKLLRGTNVSVNFDHSIAAMQPISMNYTGTIAGALKNIAAQTDTSYQLDGQQMTWSAFETRTFNISFMPGTSNYMVGQDQNANNNNNAQLASQSAATGSTINQLNDSQYSNLSGALSVWNDLRNTLNQLKSKDGSIVVSQSTTTITVTDHPENVRAMADYINQMNNVMSQQVSIKVQVLDVTTSDESNYGINWNVVSNALHTQYRIMGNLADSTNLIANQITGDSNAATSSAGVRIGNDTSHAIINAIAQQGDVRVVNEPQVVTLNNQIASIRITQDTGYIQSVSSSAANQTVTSAINPGTVREGLTLYLLPKIQNGDVYLQISSTMSDLLRLAKVNNKPDASQSATAGPGQIPYQAIEVPTLSSKSFNQRSVVRSGSTLIIAGYKRLRDETSAASMFTVPQAKGLSSKHVETVVLITPVIMSSTAG